MKRLNTVKNIATREPQLLQGKDWESAIPHVLRTLGWPSTADAALTSLGEELDKAYRQTAERWANNPAVRIEPFAGPDKLGLSTLDKLEELSDFKLLKNHVQTLLPHIDLPGLVLEVIFGNGSLIHSHP